MYRTDENGLQIAGGRLVGRRILIAGGGGGIGRAVATLCAAEGATISILGRQPDRLNEVVAATGGLAVCVDLRNEIDTISAIKTCALSMGGLDGLVNAVGSLDVCTLQESTLERWNESIMTNLTVPFLTCRASLPYLADAAKDGRPAAIVNIAALAGLMPGVSSAGYSAAKAGLLQFSRTIAAELGPAIRVNCVTPGAVDTSMTAGFFETGAMNREDFISRYNLKRMARPDEVASVVAFLLSAEASCVVGANFIADGGRAYR